MFDPLIVFSVGQNPANLTRLRLKHYLRRVGNAPDAELSLDESYRMALYTEELLAQLPATDPAFMRMANERHLTVNLFNTVAESQLQANPEGVKSYFKSLPFLYAITKDSEVLEGLFYLSPFNSHVSPEESLKGALLHALDLHPSRNTLTYTLL